MNIVVLNVGSSSLKFQLIDAEEERFSDNSDRRLARGQIERIGGEAVMHSAQVMAHRPRERPRSATTGLRLSSCCAGW